MLARTRRDSWAGRQAAAYATDERDPATCKWNCARKQKLAKTARRSYNTPWIKPRNKIKQHWIAAQRRFPFSYITTAYDTRDCRKAIRDTATRHRSTMKCVFTHFFLPLRFSQLSELYARIESLKQRPQLTDAGRKVWDDNVQYNLAVNISSGDNKTSCRRSISLQCEPCCSYAVHTRASSSVQSMHCIFFAVAGKLL